MRFASIAFVKHVVKHTVYKRSRQGCTPDPHRNQKSGSPCPITPPELETLPHAGPRGDHPGARGRGGSPFPENRPVFIQNAPRRSPVRFPGPPQGGGIPWERNLFYVSRFVRFGQPIQCQRILFLCRHFSAFWARQGAFPGWACPFVRGEGPSPGLHRPLRACVRELSRMSRNTTSKAKSPKPDFFRWGGADIGREKENDFPLFSPQNRRYFAGSQSHSPVFPWEDP